MNECGDWEICTLRANECRLHDVQNTFEKREKHCPYSFHLNAWRVKKAAIHMLMLWWFNRCIATSASLTPRVRARLHADSLTRIFEMRIERWKSIPHFKLPFHRVLNKFIREKKKQNIVADFEFVVLFPHLRNEQLPSVWHGLEKTNARTSNWEQKKTNCRVLKKHQTHTPSTPSERRTYHNILMPSSLLWTVTHVKSFFLKAIWCHRWQHSTTTTTTAVNLSAPNFQPP